MVLGRRTLLRLLATAVVVASVAAVEVAEAAAARPAPARGATVSKPPELRWKRVPSARFYNVQVFRNGHKILSRWPRRARFDLHRKWKQGNRTRHFRPAVYRWYVWPHRRYQYGHRIVRSWFKAGKRPRNTVRPTLSGSAREGARLLASGGRWTGTRPISVTYRWQRCNSLGQACLDVQGEREPSYLLSAADIDARIRVVVTGTNWLGERSVATAPTRAVLPAAPVLVDPPELRGRPQVGRILTSDVGAWSSSRSLSYRLRWDVCRHDRCRTVAVGTGRSLLLQPSMFLRTVRVVVTASNAGGRATAATARTARIGLILRGTPLEDRLIGTIGSDAIFGVRADDLLRGGPGPDSLNGGRGRDRYESGSGDDSIKARDRDRDVIHCGGGSDKVLADRRDRVGPSCEAVDRG